MKVNFRTQMKAVMLISLSKKMIQCCWTLVITVLWMITACVSDGVVLWEDVDSYSGQQEMFSGISGPQDSRLML